MRAFTCTVCWGNRLVIWNDRAMPMWVRAVDGQARYVLSFEVHRAFGGLELPGEDVEQGGLTGPVGTDQSHPFPRLDTEGHVAQGGQTSEMYGDALNVKQSHGSASSIP